MKKECSGATLMKTKSSGAGPGAMVMISARGPRWTAPWPPRETEGFVWETWSVYSIWIFVIALFGWPLPWLPGIVAPSVRHWGSGIILAQFGHSYARRRQGRYRIFCFWTWYTKLLFCDIYLLDWVFRRSFQNLWDSLSQFVVFNAVSVCRIA